VVTEVWIYEQKQLERLQAYMEKIFAFMTKHDIDFLRPSGITSPMHPRPNLAGRQKNQELKMAFDDMYDNDYPEDMPHDETIYTQDVLPVVLVLEFRLSGRVGYYFASHPTQSLFWLDEFDFSERLASVRIQHTQSSVGVRMKQEYWAHNDLFPHLYELEDDDLQELEDMLEFAVGGERDRRYLLRSCTNSSL